MKVGGHQHETLFGTRLDSKVTKGATPASAWDKDAAKRALDDLFAHTLQYKKSRSLSELLRFVARFRFYSPFNAMLIHIQMPGARYVATAHRWLRDYGRRIRAGARPLVILQPKGPVMFVFDVSDTEPTEHARPLPKEVERPFEVRRGRIGYELERLIENAKRDGVRIRTPYQGSQRAGSICPAPADVMDFLSIAVKSDKHIRVPVQYDMLVNGALEKESQFATVVHELAHLYCGHLGTPNPKWWPDRRGLDVVTMEFEAESVAYLICARFGVDNPSEEYLAGYVAEYDDAPPISLDCVMRGAGLIETMCRQKMKPRGTNDE